jgi:hypothetical protein
MRRREGWFGGDWEMELWDGDIEGVEKDIEWCECTLLAVLLISNCCIIGVWAGTSARTRPSSSV